MSDANGVNTWAEFLNEIATKVENAGVSLEEVTQAITEGLLRGETDERLKALGDG